MSFSVAIEGIDASGKATQSKLLSEKLDATLISFPDYSTPAGKLINGLLKQEWACDSGTLCIDLQHIDATVLQALMTVNRLELLPFIKNATRPIVFDRYWASGVVYGVLDGLSREWIELIQAPLPEPDLWIYLDVSPEESVRRRPERRDRYEKEPGLMEKVRASYLRLFEEKAQAARKRWHVVRGEGAIEEVHARILKLMPPQPKISSTYVF